MNNFLILGSTCLLAFVWSKIRSKKHPPLPPGPPADPILGHLRHIPPGNQETLFYEWGKVYGDVIHLHFIGNSIIVLNSTQAAIDLLDKRSSNYSDRPKFVVFNLLGFTGNYTLSAMPYGKQFQLHRRMLHQYLMEKRCLPYRPTQVQEAGVLLQNLLLDEDRREHFIQRFSAAIIMKVGYGHQITSDDDPYIKIAEDAGNAVNNAGSPGSSPLELLPFMQYFPSWFPGGHHAKYIRENRGAIHKLHDYPFEQVQKQMDEGTIEPSFLSHYLEVLRRDGDRNRITKEDVRGAGGMLYFAAADTTATTLSIFFLAMVLHPECQAEAQKEIDTIVGTGRLPGFQDRESLPYVNCVMQESMRWNNAVPMGVPHRSMEDDVYNGMFIPKGSTIIANTRAMTLDERIYNDPHRFNPSRYLPRPEGNAEPYPSGVFGFGRRVCPGRHLADASIWIAIASVLATLDISKAIGKDGREITPEVTFTSGVTSHPRPYQCHIRARNEAAQRLIGELKPWDGY